MSNRHYILTTLIKILIVVILMMVLLVIGAMIGYGAIGGRDASGVFSHSLWQHIFSFFEK